jgi:hypothetical protein
MAQMSGLPVALLVAGPAGCSPGERPPEDTGPGFSYPLDDVLRFNDVQAVGTHNSYHEETPGNGIPEWDYTHAPLDEQLGAQGVRQFELDIWWDKAGGFDVYHVPLADQASNCERLDECLATIRGWSEANPAHHPILTLLEVKTEFGEDAAALLDDLDQAIFAFGGEREVITPDEVQGDFFSLREAAAEHGWPTLGELRGRAAFVLHTDADYRLVYTENDTTTAGRMMFPDAHGDTTIEVCAYSSVNDPMDTDGIAVALDAGHLVRTRADSDTTEARENDTTHRAAALASGANFVSTDFPVPHPDTGYVVEMPGGTPSRCNPVTAPAACTPEAVEDPAFIGE